MLFDLLEFGFFGSLHVVQLLVGLALGFCDLGLELQHQLHVFGVFVGERLDQDLALLDLALELLDESEVVAADAQDFFFFVLNQLF